MKIYRKNQYDDIKSYLVCYPVNFRITDRNSEHFNKINYEMLYYEYNNFINSLIEEGIKLEFIDISNFTHQVFTKDIGFVINKLFFICNMKEKCRSGEVKPLKEMLKKSNIDYYEIKNNIEGGDINLHGDEIFVGISSRTTIEAADELQHVLNDRKINIRVVPIYFDNTKLHLDCVFNTLDKDSCIVSPYVYNIDDIKLYISNIYEITKEDADKLGTNFIYLGNKKVFISNVKVLKFLEKEGYDAKFIKYDEIMKAGGSLSCSTLEIIREH